jgi:hypothetical protein
MTLVASALLTGARIFLSFDARRRSLAASQGLSVFPTLSAKEKESLAALQ